MSIPVGQVGVQIGNTCSEFHCLEHTIQVDGKVSFSNTLWGIVMPAFTYPSVRLVQENVPRAVFVDLVSTVLGMQVGISAFSTFIRNINN
jgi:tubulin alpha